MSDKNIKDVHLLLQVKLIDPEMVHRLATLGLSREMIANYHGLSKAKFAEALEDYPELEDAFMMGFSAGLAKTAIHRRITMAIMICIAMALINIPFIIDDPSRYINWLCAGFCLGLGVGHYLSNLSN